mgnify:CR=1 FL=1
MTSQLLRGLRPLRADSPVDVRVRDGVIVDVGNLTPGAAEEVRDFDGRRVMPGLVDHHVHVTQWATLSRRLDLSASASAADATGRVAAALADNTDEVFVGFGFRAPLWTDRPTVAGLDAATGARPVVLASADLHSVWLNSAALHRFGYDPADVDSLLTEDAAFAVLRALDTVPVETSDAWVDDARLVVLNAMLARDKGADVQTRTRCVKAVRGSKHWTLTLEREGGEQFTVSCRGLVNAAGPWVKTFYDESLSEKSPRGIRLIKGSHMIVPRIHEREEAYILQNEDNRIVFVIPYQQDYSLIGTTDVEHKGSPREAKISDAEINYLCKVVNAHFTRQISPADVVWTYAGVRPLCDDESDSPQAVTRDYTLELSGESDGAPLLSVFGGKLTTYRKLAQAACNKLKPWFSQMGEDWTASCRLPGGEFDCSVRELARAFALEFDWLDDRSALRIAESYGAHARLWLKEERGQHFGAGLYESEVRYLIAREWAHSLEDILWRRSKLGLRLSESEQQQLGAWLLEHHHALPKAS